MDVILRILAEPDPCSLLGLIAVLAWIGNAMVAGQPRSRLLGYRLAAASFVGYGLYAAFVEEPRDADGFLFIAIRSLFASGWMLTGGWVVLSVVAYIYGATIGAMLEKMRIARMERQYERQAAQRREEAAQREEAFRGAAVVARVEEHLTPERTKEELLAQANEEYECELRMIGSLNCPEDERKSRILYAERKQMLRRAEIFK